MNQEKLNNIKKSTPKSSNFKLSPKEEQLQWGGTDKEATQLKRGGGGERETF